MKAFEDLLGIIFAGPKVDLQGFGELLGFIFGGLEPIFGGLEGSWGASLVACMST